MKIWPAALITVIFMMSFHSTGYAGEKTITLSELNKSRIIGYLGRPLGSIVTIEGTVVDDCYRKMKSDEGEILLKVQKVDGKDLSGEIIIPLRLEPSGAVKKPLPGYRFRFMGYETGSFTGMPEEAFRYIPQAASEGFQFKTYFLVIREEKQ
ncbi:MAG: hypothetical protein AB9903_28425 [Vulcanimicrobiota bacterium]